MNAQNELQEIGRQHRQFVTEGRWDDVMQLLLTSLQRFPEEPNLHLLTGLALCELQRPADAIGFLSKAYQAMPDDQVAHLFYAIALHRAGRLPEALVTLEALLEADPTLLAAVAHRGLVRLALQDPAGEQDLRRFLMRRSESSGDLLGPDRPLCEEAQSVLTALGRPFPVPTGEALELLRLLESRQPDALLARCQGQRSAWHHYYRAEALQALGRPQEAAQAASQALAVEPDLIDAYRLRGDACARFDLDQAEKDYRHYLQVGDPYAGFTWGCLGKVYRGRKQLREAAQALERCCTLLQSVDNGHFLEYLGVTYLAMGQPHDGLAALEKAMAMSRGCSPDVLFFRGSAKVDVGRHPEGRADLEAYLRAHPQGNKAEAARKTLSQPASAPPPTPAPPAPAQGGGFFSKLFGGKKSGYEDPDDDSLRALKVAAKKGNWKELHRFLGQVRGDARAYYLTNLTRSLSGRPSWLDAWLKAHQDDPLPWLFRGAHSIDWANEGRGSAWGNETSQQQHRTFHERLGAARKELTTAASLDPRDATPLALLIAVSLGLQEPVGHGRDLFKHALSLEPGSRLAHWHYQARLAERWSELPGAVGEFAYRLHEREPAGSPLHVIAVQGCLEMIVDARRSFEDLAHNKELQKLIKSCYVKGLASPAYRPDVYTLEDRNRYLFALFFSGHVEEAREQLEIIGMRKTEWPWKWLPDVDCFAMAREYVLQARG